MARKRSKWDPASPSEEEKEETDDEGSSSEEEEEHPKTQASTPTQKTPPAKKSAASAAAQSDESDSGSESESDSVSESESDSDGPPPEVEPIATKPMEASVPVKASLTKRASESEQGPKQAKRAKKKAGEEGTCSGGPVAEEGKKTEEDAKKLLFQRVFTEDDEIALLSGMLGYHAEKGDDPYADLSAFYDYVKESVHTKVTKAQTMDKVKRLKKRYEKISGKGKQEEERTFSKVHDGRIFDLSKKIWGKEGISGKNENSVAKSNGKGKAVLALKSELLSTEKKVDGGEAMDSDKKGSDSGVCLFDKRYGGVGGLEEKILKHGLEKVGAEKKAALEGRWRKLQIAELELSMERYVLMADHGNALLEVYKSEDK